MYAYAISKFLPASGFKWINPEWFGSNKYTSNSLRICVLKVDLEYLKELRKLQNDYPPFPDKKEIKREIKSEYQLKIDDLCNIRISNVKKLVFNFFDKEKNVIQYEHLQLDLRLALKLKKHMPN